MPRRVAAVAARREKQRGPGFPPLVIARRRRRQRARIKHDQLQPVVGDFALRRARRPIGRAVAGRLRRRAILLGEQTRSNPDIPVKRPGALLEHRRYVRLPAETPQREPARLHAPHLVHPPRNPVPVRIGGIRPRPNLRLRNRFQQTHPEHRRRNPRRNHDLLVQRPERQIVDRVDRLEQRVRFSVRILPVNLFVRNYDRALCRYAEDRPILQLPAVVRIRHR